MHVLESRAALADRDPHDVFVVQLGVAEHGLAAGVDRLTMPAERIYRAKSTIAHRSRALDTFWEERPLCTVLTSCFWSSFGTLML